MGYARADSEVHDEEGRLNTILVDFDGTMTGFTWPNKPTDPAPGVGEALTELRRLGYRIVIFTSRMWDGWKELYGDEFFEKQRDEMLEWLERHGVPYDDISCVKVPSLFIIDDRALTAPSPTSKRSRKWWMGLVEKVKTDPYGAITYKGEEDVQE